MAAILIKISCLMLMLAVIVRSSAGNDFDADASNNEVPLTKPRIKRSWVALARVLGPVLADKLIEKMGQAFVNALGAESYSFSQPEGGAWISKLTGTWGTFNGYVTSCYYHPNKKHTATTKGKLGLKTSEAGPGQWACSKQTRALRDNKTYWNTK